MWPLNRCLCIHLVLLENWTLCYFIICFDSYELHENFQKYICGVACCEYEINVCDSLTILC